MRPTRRKVLRVIIALVIFSYISFLYATQQNNADLLLFKRHNPTEKLDTHLFERQNQKNKYNYSLLTRDENFEKMLSKYAIDGVIVLSVTDLGFVEMAENLYESSFKRFNIDNYLFVCSHEKAEQYLVSRNIHAVSLWNDSHSVAESSWGGKNYITKTSYKTESVYRSLCLGYTTFLVDVDIVFLQNPLPYMMQFSEEYDIIIQNEYSQINSGK